MVQLLQEVGHLDIGEFPPLEVQNRWKERSKVQSHELCRAEGDRFTLPPHPVDESWEARNPFREKPSGHEHSTLASYKVHTTERGLKTHQPALGLGGTSELVCVASTAATDGSPRVAGEAHPAMKPCSKWECAAPNRSELFQTTSIH